MKGGKALVAYVMGGDPSPALSRNVVDAVVSGGADIIEVGIPFSDPIADGRSIQEAGARALSAGATPASVLELVEEAKRRHDVPVAVMTYYNILYSRGLGAFLRSARAHGVDAMIVPDLPLDETGEYAELARENGLDTILLAAPTTSPDRMKRLVAHTSGFLYLVSLLGVTGARADIGASTSGLIRSAKRYTRGRVPLGVGFGISKPEHVSSVLAAGADAAIVGSAIVDRVARCAAEGDTSFCGVEDYVRSLKKATSQK